MWGKNYGGGEAGCGGKIMVGERLWWKKDYSGGKIMVREKDYGRGNHVCWVHMHASSKFCVPASAPLPGKVLNLVTSQLD